MLRTSYQYITDTAHMHTTYIFNIFEIAYFVLLRFDPSKNKIFDYGHGPKFYDINSQTIGRLCAGETIRKVGPKFFDFFVRQV